MELRAVDADDEALARFYHGIYLDAFAAQREPLEVWRAALRGGADFRMTVRLAMEGSEILGGIAYELYPRSRCGLVTYMVVAPGARDSGLGRRLLGEATRALYADDARVVFGEVNDPRVPHAYEDAEQAWQRLERNQRWGARIVDVRYVQPALGDGLERDRGLCLIVLPPLPEVTGAIVRDFIAELHEVTEQQAPDDEVRAILDGIPDSVSLAIASR